MSLLSLRLELLRVQAPHLLGQREMKFAVRIVLWLGNPLLDRFSLLRYCAHMGQFEPQGYADALELLNRSADFKYAADDRTTLMKLLSKQRQEFTERGRDPAARLHRGVRLARRARGSQ